MQNPRYTQDEFIRLMEQIEDEGGHQAEDADGPMVCSARKYSFTGPKSGDIVLAGCGNEAMFEVAYDPSAPVELDLPVYQYDKDGTPVYDSFTGDPVVVRMEHIDHPGESGPVNLLNTVLVCAVEDGLGWWPRYAGVMEDA